MIISIWAINGQLMVMMIQNIVMVINTYGNDQHTVMMINIQ